MKLDQALTVVALLAAAYVVYSLARRPGGEARNYYAAAAGVVGARDPLQHFADPAGADWWA